MKASINFNSYVSGVVLLRRKQYSDAKEHFLRALKCTQSVESKKKVAQCDKFLELEAKKEAAIAKKMLG